MTTLSTDSINWSINHLQKYSDTDIFPKVFEYEAIAHCREEIIKWLSKKDINQWATRVNRKCLVPKQRYGFRIATQLDPLDMVFFLALTLEIGKEIENTRIPITEKVAFSNRFLPKETDFQFFNREINHQSFREHCKELSDQYEYVVVTDIADFYHRIYFHSLENALRSAVTTLPAHSSAILKLIKNWNQNVSYGIPVGNNPSRLLTELVLDDVDRVLIAEGIVFTRWVDDYRLFCNTKQEAHQLLAKLADVIYNIQGLTLQSLKTNILTSENFVEEVLEPEEKKIFNSLSDKYWEIINDLGFHDPYTPIDYDELPYGTRKEIENLNLESLLEEQLDSELLDIQLTRFLIRTLGQLRRKAVTKRLLNESEKLYPVFDDVIRFLSSVGSTYKAATREKIGSDLLEKLNNSVVSQLPYYRMMTMSLFAGSADWGNAGSLASCYSLQSDEWFRRSLLLALGKADQYHWLRTKKKDIGQFNEWERRSFIYAASCLPKDEIKHWYSAIKSTSTELEKHIANWAKSNPITS